LLGIVFLPSLSNIELPLDFARLNKNILSIMVHFPDSENSNILTLAIMEMCRVRKGEEFRPEEVVKWLFPESWEYFVEDVYAAMDVLQKQGKIEVLENGKQIFSKGIADANLRIRAKS
jgi:hypothetical protein